MLFFTILSTMALDFQLVSSKIAHIKTNKILFFWLWCMEILPSQDKQIFVVFYLAEVDCSRQASIKVYVIWQIRETSIHHNGQKMEVKRLLLSVFGRNLHPSLSPSQGFGKVFCVEHARVFGWWNIIDSSCLGIRWLPSSQVIRLSLWCSKFKTLVISDIVWIALLALPQQFIPLMGQKSLVFL